MADTAPADIEFFEKRIRPVLVEHCYECHASDSKLLQGGLLLDSRHSIREGGDSGAGIVPGDPDASLVLQALKYETFEMPPSGKLPERTIRDFETWIRTGAADPREASAVRTTRQIDIEEGKQFWSFRPPRHVPPPAVRAIGWCRTPVDAFIKSRLERDGIEPVADADGKTLLRRAYYALIGLPPSPDEIEDFLADTDPDAFAKVVDRLLESQRFGERWGRRWLDVVRFAQSSGGGRTLLFPDAWRYRDYVIDAFNSDMPFDQFVREQIAGDLIADKLPASDWKNRRRLYTATAYLLLGPTNYELQDKDVLEMDIIDEQLDTMGKSFLGMTIGCARCHDHKFDPIPTSDYYAMAGILKSTQSVIHSNVSTWNKLPLPVPPSERRLLKQKEARLNSLRDQLAAYKKTKKQAEKANDTAQAESLESQIKSLTKRIQQLDVSAPSWPMGMVARDRKSIGDIPLAIRGVVHNSGDIVPRGVMRVALQNDFPQLSEAASGRLELADWVAGKDNPLTARVIVNRVWYWLFGNGLVRSVDNFGAMGMPPTHPELLDYLAVDFVRDDYSIKRLIRRLMLSRTFQLSSTNDQASLSLDVDNRLWWRANRHRIEAESIRDTLLHLAGRLDMRMGGPNMKPGTKIEYGYAFRSQRRSVYVPVFRNTLPPLFAAFDFADPNTQAGKRTSSTIAPQALLLMNDSWVISQCEAAGQRFYGMTGSVGARIEQCFLETLGREPTAAEVTIAERFLASQDDAEHWALLFQTLVQSIDFRYVH